MKVNYEFDILALTVISVDAKNLHYFFCAVI